VESNNPKCICGHEKAIHTSWVERCVAYDEASGFFEPKDCECKSFKLDNLSYIEALAKERNLV